MKKTISLLAVIAASMLSTGAMADAYVSGAVGSAKLNIDCEGTTKCDTSDTSYKLVGGYRFGNGFAGEIGFHNFGTMKATALGVDLTAKASAVTVAAAYQVDVTDSWGLVGRLGVANVKSKVIGTMGTVTESIKDTKTNAYFGIGANYKLTNELRVELAVDSTKAEIDGEKASVRSVNLGLNYSF